MRETIENLVSEQEIDPSREETTLTKNENTAFEE